MRFILIFLLFVSLSFCSELVQIKINKLHGLLSFTESISSSKYSLKSLQNIYNEKYKNSTEATAQMTIFKNSYKVIKRRRIYNYKNSSNLYNMLKIESTFAKNLDELKSKVLKYKVAVKKDIINEYFKTLKYFLPIYEELIWKKNIKSLRLKSAEIKELMISSKYDDLIRKTAYFYGVKNTEIDNMYLALYPIPSGDRTVAFMLGNVESIGVLVNKKKSNIKWLLSATIFHEITHTLYAKEQKKIEAYFDDFKGLSAKGAKNIFNESLSTSIGAGWSFYKITDGLISNGRWYNNKDYDRFAKKIYPIVSDYIDSKKSIDKKFIKSIISLY